MSTSRRPYRSALPRKVAVVIAATLSSLLGVVLVAAAAHVGFFRAAPVAHAADVAAVTSPASPTPPAKVVTVYEDVLVPKVLDSESASSANEARPATSIEHEVVPTPERTLSPSAEPTELEHESEAPEGSDD